MQELHFCIVMNLPFPALSFSQVSAAWLFEEDLKYYEENCCLEL